MTDPFSRRLFLGQAATASFLSSSLAASSLAAKEGTIAVNENNDPKKQDTRPIGKGFRTALNFGTLIGFNLTLEEEIDLTAKAGYDGFEPWSQGLDRFIEQGGSLADLRKRINDHGLQVTVCNAFYSWIVEDDKSRSEGIEQMKRYMDYTAQIGGSRITATSVGATDFRLDRFEVLGQRYRTILEIGEQRGVLPQLEMWAGTQTLNSLADLVAVAIHAGHPKTEFLLDVFHLYRSGSPFDSLALLNGRKMTVLHINDYPAFTSPEEAQDKDRVYPGDGVAPLPQILQTLQSVGFDGFLSFEVFNPLYWATNDPLQVVRIGRKKILKLIEKTNHPV